MTIWLIDNWLHISVPLLAFAAVLILGFFARRNINKYLKRHEQTWVVDTFVETLWRPFLLWFLMLGTYVAIEVSIFSQTIKRLTNEGLASIFVFSLVWTFIILSERLIRSYLSKTKTLQSLIPVASNSARIIVLITGILVVLEIWGVPTIPIIFLLCGCIFITGIAFRNTLSNLLAGLEIVYSEHVKVGHLVRLESGDMGHITQISWTQTIIQNDQGDLIIIPNSKLMVNGITNYGAVITPNIDNSVQKDKAFGPEGSIAKLSERETQVLGSIGSGATNREIAEKLFISECTVKSHMRSILNKLNLSNRQQAAVCAQREGLITERDSTGTD